MPVSCSEPLGCRTRGKSGVFCSGFVPGSESGRLQPAFMILSVDGPPLRGRDGAPRERGCASLRPWGLFLGGTQEQRHLSRGARTSRVLN